MTGLVTVDIAGAQVGGAARYAAELFRYLGRTGRQDVQVIGAGRHVNPAWLLRRETVRSKSGRRVAVNNVSFISPGGQRWALLRNALHFLADDEAASLGPALPNSIRREGAVVRLAARRADVLVVPCTTMAERVTRVIPAVRSRMVVRPHPVSSGPVRPGTTEAAILCPILFSPYKQMDERLAELLDAVAGSGDPAVRVRVTADRRDLPPAVASRPGLEFLGRIDQHDLRQAWMRSRAIYFPTGLESFGYPLAEARANGLPVIARDTAQNREIAGPALCGFEPGEPDSMRQAVKCALTTEVAPDPLPFDPDAYFGWLLGCAG